MRSFKDGRSRGAGGCAALRFIIAGAMHESGIRMERSMRMPLHVRLRSTAQQMRIGHVVYGRMSSIVARALRRTAFEAVR